MTRLLRGLWADKSLLLLGVPVLLLVLLFAADRATDRPVDAEEASDQSAASSSTTTTSAAPAEVPPGGSADGAAPVDPAAAGFDSGGVTVTDDDGNLVRLSNDLPRAAGTPGAPTSPGSAAGVGPEGADDGATTTSAPSATPTSAPTTAPGSTVPSTTTTLPVTTTTTPVTEPPPVVPESPLSALLPVSAVLAGGLGLVAVTRRRGRRARLTTTGPRR
jgi:hypothetical protein